MVFAHLRDNVMTTERGFDIVIPIYNACEAILECLDSIASIVSNVKVTTSISIGIPPTCTTTLTPKSLSGKTPIKNDKKEPDFFSIVPLHDEQN